MAAPLLDLWSPRGVYPHTPLVRHRFRDLAGVFAKTTIWLLSHRDIRSRYWLHGLGCLGASYVCLWSWSGRCGRVLCYHHVHCSSNGCKNSELDCNDVGRQPQIYSADDVLNLPGFDVHHRRPVRSHALGRPRGHPANRHLLHRRSFSLCALWWGTYGVVRWDVLLVA